MKRIEPFKRTVNGTVAERKLVERDLSDYPDTPEGDAAFKARVPTLSAVVNPPSDAARATAFRAVPGVIVNKGIPNFTDVEVKEVNDQFFLNEKITGGAYTDARPRYYYVDGLPIGPTLSNWGPLRAGGLYQIEVRRWDANKPIWGHTAGGADYNNMQLHVFMLLVPGQQGEPGAVRFPNSFRIANPYIRRVKDVIPAFRAIAGKVNPTYRYSIEDTNADYYERGATHMALWAGETNPDKQLVTTALANAANLPFVGTTVDDMGEINFRNLSDAQIDQIANSLAPNSGILFLDFEKSPSYGTAGTYWSIPLETPTLPKYYRLLQKIRERYPDKLLGDYYRPLVWNKSFSIEAVCKPLEPVFLAQYDAPYPAGAYRTFGSNQSLRDVTNIHIIDAYPATKFETDLQRNLFLHQPYSMIHDTRIARKLLPNGQNLIWFGWDGSDTEGVEYRHYQRAGAGWAWRQIRTQPPAWFAMFCAIFGNVLGDGFHFWHDMQPNTSDPTKIQHVPNGEGWEPDTPGTPSPFGSTGPNFYPREYKANYLYAMMGEFLVSQIQDILVGATLHDCSIKIGTGNYDVLNGEKDILYKAAGKRPIVIEVRGQSDSAIIACAPFNPANSTLEVVAKVRGDQTKAFTLSGQWPTVVRVSTPTPGGNTGGNTGGGTTATTVPAYLQKLAYRYDQATKGLNVDLLTSANAGVQVRITQSGSAGNGWSSGNFYNATQNGALAGYNLTLPFGPNAGFTGGVTASPLTLTVRYDNTDFSVSFTPQHTANNIPANLLPANAGGTVTTPTVKYYERVLFVGNSITHHPPASNLGWAGDWGMAASAADKDYVNRVLTELRKSNPNLQWKRATTSVWEGAFWNTAKDPYFSEGRDFKPDLIVVRLGENVSESEAANRDFKGEYLGLVDYLRAQNPTARVVLTDSFWTDQPSATAKIKQAASDRGYPIVTFDDVRGNTAYLATQYANAGVAKHPNDAGMQLIAQRLIDVIPTRSAPTSGGNLIDFDFVPLPALANWPDFDPSFNHHGFQTGEVAYLDNGKVRVGVRKRYGAAPCYVSFSGSAYNMVNNTDHGRQNQMTWYGSPEGEYCQNGKCPTTFWPGMGYNPIQAGSWNHKNSPVLAFGMQNGVIYTKTRMLLWPLDNELSDCVLEQWVRLNDWAIEVFTRSTFTRTDGTFYEVDQQEHPCMMGNGSRRRVHFYNGNNPYANDSTTLSTGIEIGADGAERINEQTPFHVTEPWIAIEYEGLGYMGLYSDNCHRVTNTQYDRHLTDTGEFDSACTYTANVPMAFIDQFGVYIKRHAFVLSPVANGLSKIREYVYSQPRQVRPDFTFTVANGRCDWIVNKGHDQKEPFTSDVWRVVFHNREGSVRSPVKSWRASDFNVIKIQMAYTGTRPKLNLMWLLGGQKPAGFNPDRPQQEQIRWPNGSRASAVFDDQNIQFDVIGDGVERVYTVYVGNKAGWKQIIQEIEIGYYYQWMDVQPNEQLHIRRVWGENGATV